MSGAGVVLLWGVSQDPPIALVHQALQAKGCPVVLLDQWKVAETEVDVVASPCPDGEMDVAGALRFGDQTYDLRTVRSAYMRPYDHAELPFIAEAGAGSALWRHAYAVEDTLTTWADLAPSLVVNRPRAMVANGSKPRQSAWIAALGFRVPATLITTDTTAAIEFWEEHGEVIYKSISGTRSIVSRLRSEHRARLKNLAACPTQFQQYIPGVEYRAHVVGEQVFACRILSAADDYRYAKEVVDVKACALPGDISQRCRTMAAAMELPLAGIDLRCTPEGAWYCLEVNPSPGFSYFDVDADQSIAEAVAALLAEAPLPGESVRRRKASLAAGMLVETAGD